MGSFLNKKENGLLEIPTSASWVPYNPNMLLISYKNPLLGLFDRVTGRSKGIIKVERDDKLSILNQQINKVVVHNNMPLAITAHENKYVRFFDLNSSKY